MLGAIEDEEGSEDAAEAVRRAGRPRCSATPSFGSMGSGRVARPDDDEEGADEAELDGPALLSGITVRMFFVP